MHDKLTSFIFIPENDGVRAVLLVLQVSPPTPTNPRDIPKPLRKTLAGPRCNEVSGYIILNKRVGVPDAGLHTDRGRRRIPHPPSFGYRVTQQYSRIFLFENIVTKHPLKRLQFCFLAVLHPLTNPRKKTFLLCCPTLVYMLCIVCSYSLHVCVFTECVDISMCY